MIDTPKHDFTELVSFRLPEAASGIGETHGTTVLALRFKDGVLMLADRRATMGNLIMFERAEKIVALDDRTLVAISGAYARSIEICRFLQHGFKYYSRLNLQELSVEGKLMEISRALSNNLPMAMQGVGVFLPIVAAFDPSRKTFGLYFFDTAGARFESTDYACAGSGSERIRGVFEYLSRVKQPWNERGLDDVLGDALTMLDIAADLDSATGGFSKILPVAAVLDSNGVKMLGQDELEPVAKRVLARPDIR